MPVKKKRLSPPKTPSPPPPPPATSRTSWSASPMLPFELIPGVPLSNAKDFTEEDEAFMRVAFEQGKAALGRGEVPVGVVYVRDNKIVAIAGNETNEACDATRHAELVALESMDNETIRECKLYVTVEPCIMCAGALAAVHVKSVIFGCANDKFGGCGSVLPMNERSTFPDDEDHEGFESRGGLGRDEAVALLREFYARENDKTPRPRLDGTAKRVAKRKANMSNAIAAAVALAAANGSLAPGSAYALGNTTIAGGNGRLSPPPKRLEVDDVQATEKSTTTTTTADPPVETPTT